MNPHHLFQDRGSTIKDRATRRRRTGAWSMRRSKAIDPLSKPPHANISVRSCVVSFPYNKSAHSVTSGPTRNPPIPFSGSRAPLTS
jgi:hypothetical protein